MKISKYHTISDDDESEKSETEEPNASKSPESSLLEKCFATYECNENFKTKIFDKNGQEDVLYKEDITDEDEVYLLQCPVGIDVRSFINKRINFDEASKCTKIKLRNTNKRKKYNLYSFKSENCPLGCILPSRKKHRFQITTLPLSGRLILQEDIHIHEDKSCKQNNDQSYKETELDENVSTYLDYTNATFEEEITPPKKKHENVSTYLDYTNTTFEEEIVPPKKKRKKGK